MNKLINALLKRQADGWQFARVSKSAEVEFISYYLGETMRFLLRKNAEGILRVVINNKNYGAVTTSAEVKQKLLRYSAGHASESLPKVLRGSEHELGDELKGLVLKYLRNELCQISFVKVDGTKREMLGTLLLTFLPEFDLQPAKAAVLARREHNPFLITVYDVECQDWRSFDLARLLRISVV